MNSREKYNKKGAIVMEKKIRPESIVTKGDMFILGEYVLAPQQNAFNKLKSYWISKKLCTISVYAFTPKTKEELSIENIANSFNSYITMFEETLERLSKE